MSEQVSHDYTRPGVEPWWELPTVKVRTINKGTDREFDRVFLYCPNGHEGTSAPAESRTGRKFLAGDFSGEWCGHIGCRYDDGYAGESIFGDH